MAHTAELLLDTKSDLGEGALWDADRKVFLWVNIIVGEVHLFDPATGSDRCIDVGQPVGTVVSRGLAGLTVALKRGFYNLDVDSGEISALAEPVDDPDHRFNDGKCDPSGRFWAGSCHMNCSDPVGTLYCLHTDGTADVKLTDLHCPNGIVWTADRQTMYYIDSPTGEIWGFDYEDATGDLSNKRVIATVPSEDGIPDGMTIDSDGRLWVAHWGGYGVYCWDPATGSVVDKIEVPSKQVTSCAFGGDDLQELMITSAATGLSDEELAEYPHSGSLFRCRPGATGVAPLTYG